MPVRYAEELNVGKSSVLFKEPTDIGCGAKPPDFQCLVTTAGRRAPPCPADRFVQEERASSYTGQGAPRHLHPESLAVGNRRGPPVSPGGLVCLGHLPCALFNVPRLLWRAATVAACSGITISEDGQGAGTGYGQCCITSRVALWMGRHRPRAFSGGRFPTSLRPYCLRLAPYLGLGNAKVPLC